MPGSHLLTHVRGLAPALFFVLLAVGCDHSAPQSQEAAQHVEAAPDTNVFYVDVRSPGEFSGGHVKGAVNIPHDQMGERWRELMPYRDKTLVLYCASGKRSGIAEEVLRSNGFTNVRNAGGIDDLEDAGVPITEE